MTKVAKIMVFPPQVKCFMHLFLHLLGFYAQKGHHKQKGGHFEGQTHVKWLYFFTTINFFHFIFIFFWAIQHWFKGFQGNFWAKMSCVIYFEQIKVQVRAKTLTIGSEQPQTSTKLNAFFVRKLKIQHAPGETRDKIPRGILFQFIFAFFWQNTLSLKGSQGQLDPSECIYFLIWFLNHFATSCEPQTPNLDSRVLWFSFIF